MKKPTPLRIRYFAQPEPKCKYQTFRMRVNRRWMTKEEALNPNVDTRKYSSKTNIQLKEYLENYKWEKVWYARFIEMFKVCWDEEKAIKPWTITLIDRYPEQYAIYKLYPQPKCSFSQFMIRFRLWKSIEDCVRATSWARPWWLKVYDTHAEAKRKLYKWDNYLIEITYSKEEASVFRNVYLKMIDDLEIEMIDCSPLRDTEIKKQLKELNHELEIFNIYNPI